MSQPSSVFLLPWPPSENNYRRAVRTKTGAMNTKTTQARGYPALCKEALKAQEVKPMTGPVELFVAVVVPDKRKRDLDNLLKGVQDALTANGIYEDDSQICQLMIWWNKVPVIPSTPWEMNFVASNKGFLIVQLREEQ